MTRDRAGAPWADAWASTVASALATRGGDALVLDTLRRVPQVRVVEVKTGWRSSVTTWGLGDRRFRTSGDGRLVVEHEVHGVVLSTAVVSPAEGGEAVADALAGHVAQFGPSLLPELEAALAGLAAAAGIEP